MDNKPRFFSEIVYLRAIAILAVISIHVSAYFTLMERVTFLTFLYLAVDTISHFAVPLFVCISGFLLYNKYKGSYSVKKFYKKRFLSVIPQYLFFTLIALLFNFIGTIYFRVHWKENFLDIIYQILTGTAFYFLWFFVLIIQLYAFYPIIERIFTKFLEKGKIMVLLLILYGIQVLLQDLFTVFSIHRFTDLIGTLTLFLGYIFFFGLGMYISSIPLNYTNLANASKYFYIIFFVLIFGSILGIGNLYNTNFSTGFLIPFRLICAIVDPLYYVTLIILCVFVALKISEVNQNMLTKPLQIIGNFSFGIYLVHVFILVILASVIFPKVGLNSNNFLFFPIVFFLVLIFSICAVYILKRVPCHEFIIGY